MTIATRPDWNGNAASHTFDDIGSALEYMKTNPCYEILPEDTAVRPFGDIDFKVGDEVTEAEFHKLDFEVFNAVAEFFRVSGRAVTQFSASSWEYRKISHRWVVPDTYVKTITHAKAFAADLYSRVELPAGAVGDMSVYSKLRKMRTLWTSKPNENRPFYMLQGEEEDHVISFIPKTATLLDFQLEEPQSDPKPVCTDYETSYVTQLCDCVAVATWEDYTACQALIFTLLSLGTGADLIHHYCSKAKNYSWAWVNGYLCRYDAKKNRHSIGTLKFYARRDAPTQYAGLGRDKVYSAGLGRQMFKEMTRLTEDEATHQNWCDEKGYLKALPVAATIGVKSHLGTGKTRRCIEACTPSPWNPTADKVVVMSCRQTFTTHITAELKGFVDYRTIKGTEIAEDKLVVQVQSLWKCAAMEPRDLVLLDEVESILANLTPNQTHKHYVETVAVFEQMIRSAKRVIVLDAFLSDRTMEMLRTLRGDVVLVINPTIPYKRTATLVSERGLSDAIHSKLRNGKRLVAVWGAKSKAKAFHSCVPSSVKHVLYTGDSDAKIKETHLANVDRYWAEHQLVGYTATITVGVNYNGLPFDEACVYATAWSCCSRDYIQALHRARKLSDEQMTIYINPSPRPCSLEAGLEEQEAQFAKQTDRVKKFLSDIKQNVLDYATLPPWLHRVLMWNYNETITNYKHFPECMLGFLALSGVACGSELPEIAAPEKAAATTRIAVADVDTIDYETAQTYSRNRQMLTDTQRYELEKYYMVQKVTKVDEFIWNAWLDARKQVDRSWTVMNLRPDQLIHDKVLDLVPKDAERLKVFQDLGLDWDSAWSMEAALVPKVDIALFGQRVRSEKDTVEQYCRDLSKALKQWCGVETKVERTRVRQGGDLGYTFALRYDPHDQLFSYVARPRRAADIFAED